MAHREPLSTVYATIISTNEIRFHSYGENSQAKIRNGIAHIHDDLLSPRLIISYDLLFHVSTASSLVIRCSVSNAHESVREAVSIDIRPTCTNDHVRECPL